MINYAQPRAMCAQNAAQVQAFLNGALELDPVQETPEGGQAGTRSRRKKSKGCCLYSSDPAD